MKGTLGVLLMMPCALLVLSADSSQFCGPGANALLDAKGLPKKCKVHADCEPPAKCHQKSGVCCGWARPADAHCPAGMVALVVKGRALRCGRTSGMERIEVGDGRSGAGTNHLNSMGGTNLNNMGKTNWNNVGSTNLNNVGWSSTSASANNTCPPGSSCLRAHAQAEAPFFCCVVDPAEGCAPGSRLQRRAAAADDRPPRACTPASQRQRDSCPADASCQWSFAAARYQCCEPDDGCPRGQRPMLDSELVVRACSPGQPNACPMGGTCWFNVWLAAHQCCQPKLEALCHASQVVFLSPDGPVSCETDRDCPSTFNCYHNVCCGPPGKCPRPAQRPARDEHGLLRPCFAPGYVDCPGQSSCEPVLYATALQWKQQLCCAKIELSCANDAVPFPSADQPMQCEIADPASCPQGSECQASNVPNSSICCEKKTLKTEVCPKGWILQSDKVTTCAPGGQDCELGGDCVLSPLSQRFVCCVRQVGAERRRSRLLLSAIRRQQVDLSCPYQFVGPEIFGRRERTCTRPGGRGECSAGFVCVPAVESAFVYLCCGPAEQRDDARFRCPNAGQVEVLENGQNLVCDPISNNCPRGATCQSAINSFMMMICCYNTQAQTPLCPADSAPQQSGAGYVPCDPNSNSQCDPGYLCLPSVNQPQTYICCSRSLTTLVCPNQQSVYLELGRAKVCNPQQISPCPSGYICTQSASSINTFICCSLPNTATCPAGYLVVNGFSGLPMRCSLSSPNDCPADSQCLPSPNQPGSAVCCQSSAAPRVCPEGYDALIQANGRVERCSGPGSACPDITYTCQLAPYLNYWVCCRLFQPTQLCADGSTPFSQIPGSPVRCNLFSFPSECPAGYECQASSLAGVNNCCPRRFGPTPTPTPAPYLPQNPDRPLGADLGCPVGWSAFEDAEGAYRFCGSPLDRSCPLGFSCAQSSVLGVFVCCRLAASMECANQAATPFIVNNAPKLCLRLGANTCPAGFSCQPANVAPVHICCSLPPPAGFLNGGVGQLPFGTVPAGFSSAGLNGFAGGVNGFTTAVNGFPTGVDGFASGLNVVPAGLNVLPAGLNVLPAGLNVLPAGLSVLPTAVPPALTGLATPLNGLPGVAGPLPANPNPAPITITLNPCVPLSPTTSAAFFNPQLQLGTTPSLCCPDGTSPAYLGSQLVQCPVLGSPRQCPPTYVCTPSAQPSINICCHLTLRLSQRMRSRKVSSACDSASIPVTNGQGEPLQCSADRPNQCPGDSECKRGGAGDTVHFCCVRPQTDEGRPAQPVMACDGNEDCGEGELCSTVSNVQGARVCTRPNDQTPPTKPKARCLATETLLVSGHGLSCARAADCPSGYQCSERTTTGDRLCCKRDVLDSTCPDNRIPSMAAPDLPQRCDPGAPNDCPMDFLCKKSVSGSDSFLCCSRIAFCPPGRVPELDAATGHAKRCTDEECAPGYKCTASSVADLRVCCSTTNRPTSTRLQSQLDQRLWSTIEG